MKSVFFSLCILSVCFLLGEGTTTGERTWGEACNPSASLYDDQSTRCDTSKRLSCDMKTRVCMCHHGDRDKYNKDTDSCETQVGKFCSASETFPTICVKNAVCDGDSNFCVCEPGASLTEDKMGCIKEDDENNSASSISLQKHFIYGFITILTIATRYWL